MNKAQFEGVILEITPSKSFIKNNKEYNFRTVVIETGEEFIAANYWQDGELPPVGTEVSFQIKISSDRNNKNPEIFYHKVNLHSIHERSRFPTEVQY